MSRDLIIVGDSAFGEIAFEYFSFDSEYTPVAFAVEKEFRQRSKLFGLPVVDLEELQVLYPPNKYSVFVAVTYGEVNQVRSRLFKSLKSEGYSLASYISSNAFVWRNVQIGENCFIFEDNTIQPFVKIEDNCILWSGNHIGHHTTIQENCFIASHACISGFCDIGKNSFIGVNATLANNVELGGFNWVGPDVSIMKSTKEDQMWSPAKCLPRGKGTSEFFGLT